jgi:hypothetical protein
MFGRLHVQYVNPTECARTDKNYNNKFWKLEIPLRIKVFSWYLRKGVILTKKISQSGTGMVVENVFFVMKQ